jgi:hypothetical protein
MMSIILHEKYFLRRSLLSLKTFGISFQKKLLFSSAAEQPDASGGTPVTGVPLFFAP